MSYVGFSGANGPINPAPVTPFTNVVLLCGFEGSGTADYTDESSYGHAFDIFDSGSGFGPSTPAKFGSLALGRSNSLDKNSYLRYADSSQFNFGTGPFTIECWVYFTSFSSANRQLLVGQYDGRFSQRSWALAVESGNLCLLLSTNGSAETTKASGAWSPSTSTWYHVAGDFDGTTYRTYVNGVLKASSTGTVTLHNSTSPVDIAACRDNGVDYGLFDGNIDEARVCKVAAYASDTGFAPPTAAFPRS